MSTAELVATVAAVWIGCIAAMVAALTVADLVARIVRRKAGR